jgi:hypothetical protein
VLLALGETVRGDTGHSPERPRTAWWSRSALTDPGTEILDGTYSLHPWMSPEPAEAVRLLARTRTRTRTRPQPPGLDIEAIEATATIRHARARRDAARQPGLRAPPDALGAPDARALPGDRTPPTREHDRQVVIATHLSHPLVGQALAQVAHKNRGTLSHAAARPYRRPSGPTWRMTRSCRDCIREGPGK